MEYLYADWSTKDPRGDRLRGYGFDLRYSIAFSPLSSVATEETQNVELYLIEIKAAHFKLENMRAAVFDVNTFPEDTTGRIEPRRNRDTAALWYSILFVLSQVVILSVCVGISCTHWFLSHDDYPALKNIFGYGLRAKGLDCDVVLYGDSAALTGLDPSIIHARTGLTACNVSEARAVLLIVGSYFPLDHYLANNKPPKYIVSAWAASFFYPVEPLYDYQSEGVEYAMQYDRDSTLWRLLTRRPQWLVLFAIWAGNRMVTDVQNRLTDPDYAAHWAAEAVPRDAHRGIWHFHLPSENRCALPVYTQATRDQRRAAINAFKQRYSKNGTQVFFDILPLADCTANIDQITNATTGLSDNPFQLLPMRYYTDSNVHLTSEGSTIVSQRIADQLVAIIRKDEAAKHQLVTERRGVSQTQ